MTGAAGLRFAGTVRAQLAGPRATAAVLTTLPVLGIGLGELIGAGPLGVLRGGPLGQGLLVAGYTASFARYGVRVGQVLLTSDNMSRRAHHRNASRTLDKLLAMGALPGAWKLVGRRD